MTRARLSAALPFVPAYIVVATWVVWSTHDGGYFHLIKIGSPGVYRVGYYSQRHGVAR